jgi:hypothetical protein
MKRTLLIGIIFTSFVSSQLAFAAGHIKKNTVLCLSQKDIVTYMEAIENNEEIFVRDLFYSASCYTKKREIKASYIAKVGDTTEVRTEDGFKVWLKSSAFVGNKK